MTGTQRVIELTNMAAETRDLVARWRGRGVDLWTPSLGGSRKPALTWPARSTPRRRLPDCESSPLRSLGPFAGRSFWQHLSDAAALRLFATIQMDGDEERRP